MGKRLAIGFAGISDHRNSIAQKTLAGIQKAAEDYDLDLLNFFSVRQDSLGDDIELFNHYRSKFAMMNERNLDGLVTWASSFSMFMKDDEIRAVHRRMGALPLVCLGWEVLDWVPGVFNKAEVNIGMVMDHLVNERGYSRIAFFGVLGRPQYVGRYNAWRTWLAERGMGVDERLAFLCESFDSAEFTRLVDRFLAAGGPRSPLSAQAIVTVSDIMACRVIDELAARGIRVPEDVAVTGINNQVESMSSVVPITTVDLRFEERAYRAVELLLESIEASRKGGKVQTISFPSRLVVRQSSGSFEELVVRSTMIPSRKELLAELGTESGGELSIAAALRQALQTYCPLFLQSRSARFVEAVMNDYSGRGGNDLLVFMRQETGRPTGGEGVDPTQWQMILSVARTVILNFCSGDPLTTRRMEDLLHQARILVSIMNDYRNSSMRYDNYKFNAIAQLAVDFGSASGADRVLRLVSAHLDELEMPSIVLALQAGLSNEPETAKVALVYPPSGGASDGESPLGKPISYANLHLARFVDPGRRHTHIVEPLYHRGKYMGIAFIEYGPSNIALYDMLRLLLSRALYAHFIRENHERLEGYPLQLLADGKLRGLVNADRKQTFSSGTLSAGIIVEYLSEHLEAPTNIEEIAADLGVSKSHLMHKTKDLTGYTVQVLHELLKIERAKSLLEVEDYRISDVATRLGFQNPGYFAKVFRKHTAMSPKAWRDKEHLEKLG